MSCGVSVLVMVMDVLMRLFRLSRGAILLGAHLGQLAHEGDQVPNFLIVMGFSPSRHTGRFDAVLDDPEGFRCVIHTLLGQIRRLWEEAAANLSFLNTGR